VKDELLDLLDDTSGEPGPEDVEAFIEDMGAPAYEPGPEDSQMYVPDVEAPLADDAPTTVTPAPAAKKPWVDRKPARGSRRKPPSDDPKAGGRRYYDPPKEETK
jgi:hypothetical protein